MQADPAVARVADREPEPARLLLVEPHDVARLAAHRMLDGAAPGAVGETAASWWQASAVIRHGIPDVLLFSSDAEQPGHEVVDLLHRASTKIVLVVRTSDPERLRRLLRLPVSAVLREVDLSVP